MKILHCCLSCFYIEGYTYQENILPRANAEAGNDVKIIASTETFVDNNKLGYLEPSSYINADGIPVERVPYSKLLPHSIMRKVRKYKGVYHLIEDFAPDVLLFHGGCAWELHTIIKYKKKHPAMTLYIDSHEDFNNSARTFVSKYVLHGMIYRPVLKRALKYTQKLLYITLETKQFLQSLYHISDEKLEFYPLGGALIPDMEREGIRKRVRQAESLQENSIIILHSGKLDAAKRTPELLDAFIRVPDDRFVLLIIGGLGDDVKQEVEKRIAQDTRVRYLGWRSGSELMEYLCACDLYAQPGSQSATLQSAVCCGCAIMLYPHMSYVDIFKEPISNGFYVRSTQDMARVLQGISDNPKQLQDMEEASLIIAKDVFDYKKLAARLAK